MLRRYLAVLLFLLLCSSAFSQGYWITEEELTQLETELTTAQSELKLSQAELTTLKAIMEKQETRLDGLATLSSEQIKQWATLSTLFEQYESAARLTRTALTVGMVATSLLALGLGVALVFK